MYLPLFWYKIMYFFLWILMLPWIYQLSDKITCTNITFTLHCFDKKSSTFSYGYWGCNRLTCFWTKLPVPLLTVHSLVLVWNYALFPIDIEVAILPVPSLVLVWIYALFPMDIEATTDLYVFGQHYPYQYYLCPPLFWYEIMHFFLCILRLPQIYLFLDKITCTIPYFGIKLCTFSYGYWGCQEFTSFWTNIPVTILPVSSLVLV